MGVTSSGSRSSFSGPTARPTRKATKPPACAKPSTTHSALALSDETEPAAKKAPRIGHQAMSVPSALLVPTPAAMA